MSLKVSPSVAVLGTWGYAAHCFPSFQEELVVKNDLI